MAEGFTKALGGNLVDARSGGSKPLGRVLPQAAEVMKERGIDIGSQKSKGFDEAWIRHECDLVVTMGCGDDACPAFIGKKMVDWDLADPKGKSLSEFRRVRDEIERRVQALLADHGVMQKGSGRARPAKPPRA
jgi:arsenate reductase (thioredoxin)